MKITITVLLSVILSLSGCNKTSDKDNNNLTIIEVDLSVQESTIEAHVTQGTENVKDATVNFEIWKDGEEDRVMVDGENNGDGIYSITTNLDSIGTYNVIAHTYARGMHTMPKLQFKIKNPK